MLSIKQFVRVLLKLPRKVIIGETVELIVWLKKYEKSRRTDFINN